MAVEKITDSTNVEKIEHVMAESPSFEEIEKELGKVLIYVMRDRRNHYHTQTEVYEKEYKEQVKKHADSYRGWAHVVFLTGDIALSSVTILSVTAPQAVQAIGNRVGPLQAYLQKFHSVDAAGVRQIDYAKMSQEISSVTASVEKVFGAVKGFHGTIQQANRTEAQAYQELLRGQSEQKRQEQQRASGEEQEAIRNFQNARNKRDDYMMGYAK